MHFWKEKNLNFFSYFELHKALNLQMMENQVATLEEVVVLAKAIVAEVVVPAR